MEDQYDQCYNKLILSPETRPVAFFTALMIFFAAFSTFMGSYFACFGEPDSVSLSTFDTVMEICFILDMIKNFFLQYTDPQEPRVPVKDLTKIIKHYITGSFACDFIACAGFPLRHALRSSLSPQDLSLIYLLRLLRLTNLWVLFSLQKFTHFVRTRYRKTLKQKIANDPRGELNRDRLNDSNKIMHQIFLIKGFQLVRIVAVIYFLSYFLGTLWFVMTKHTSNKDGNGYTFYNEYDLGNLSASENLTIVIYFMFTTLSTVGLGDYNPKSETERLLMCLMLMCGVTCFSYIMSVLTSIVYEV